MSRQGVAVVTGSSSGIGLETSLAFARNGFHTYASMRKVEGGGSKQIMDIATTGENVLQFSVEEQKKYVFRDAE